MNSINKKIKALTQQIKEYYKLLFYKNDISKLAWFYGTDKEGIHFYSKHYQNHFEKYKNKKINLLEIGVGGYEDSTKGGESLRMWNKYFKRGKIYGIDLYDKTNANSKRIVTYIGDQTNETFLRKIVNEIGGVDIIIDDGSHINEQVIKSFKILFPLLNVNGIYVIEDLQTSYWDIIDGIHFGGSNDPKSEFTSMFFLKSLIDCLNYEEFNIKNYSPTYFDKHIVSIHFYHNIVFIYKGINNEGSNIIQRSSS
ncbi:MAG TPA: hypothetical protein PKX26_10240 [Prolixibacteraceae bacterium]|jgi:demethylmacrocin O-methyltransferase|nr:hypothetical protein [Prolixibacteraceae bacterium]HOG96600.1 hypothetical protein [Prolixibacteraceae bacterium]HQB27341.1 hypothetical protein [Paludibacter sp.]